MNPRSKFILLHNEMTHVIGYLSCSGCGPTRVQTFCHYLYPALRCHLITFLPTVHAFTMLPSPFPPEIQDHIIDLLHSDIAALRACACTCHVWQTTSQYHLFNSITITSEHILNQFAALIKTTRGGVIAYYVQELCITGPSSRQRVSHTWVSKVAQRLGPDLKNVHALQLRNVEWAIPHADWSIAVSFPSLVSLHIIACHFPSFDNFHDLLSTFTGFAGPALTHLSVDATGWKDASTKTPPKLNLPLQSLSIGRLCTPHVLTNWLIAVNSHKRLRSVEFHQLDEDDLPEVAQLLRRLGTNLQHLKIGLQFSQKPYMLGGECLLYVCALGLIRCLQSSMISLTLSQTRTCGPCIWWSCPWRQHR